MTNNINFERTFYECPAGLIELRATTRGLSWLKISASTKMNIPLTNPHLIQAVEWLDKFFYGALPLPIYPAFDLQGTEFQTRVWRILLEIPYGEKSSYKHIQQTYNTRHNGNTSPRAIGHAIAANPVWIIIPCHRVIYANGKSGGYAGGIEMKLALQKRETAQKHGMSLLSDNGDGKRFYC